MARARALRFGRPPPASRAAAANATACHVAADLPFTPGAGGGKKPSKRGCPESRFYLARFGHLRTKDLADLRAGRPPVGKFALKARARALCRTQRAAAVARACARSLRKTREEVIRKRGARARA